MKHDDMSGWRLALRRFWHRLFPWVGGAAVITILLTTGLDERIWISGASDKAALLGGALAFAALLVSILLGLIALLVALESRPAVQELRTDPQKYKQLVGFAFHGIVVFLLLALLSIVGFFVIASDPIAVRRGVAIGVCVLATVGGLQIYRFCWYLTGLMTDAPEADDSEGSPEAARRRAAEASTPSGPRNLPANPPKPLTSM